MVGVPRWNCAKSWKVCSITIARRSKTYRQAICSDNKNLLRQVFLCPDDGGCDYRWRCEAATITAFKMLSGVYDVPAAECRSGTGFWCGCLPVGYQTNSGCSRCNRARWSSRKMSSQLKNIDFTNHPAAADPVTMRAIQKAIALIELKFTPQGESH